MRRFLLFVFVVVTHCSVQGQWVITSYPVGCDGATTKSFTFKQYVYVTSYASQALYRTSDEGLSWENLSHYFPTNRRINDAAILGDYIIAAGYTTSVDSADGMFRSSNGGLSWEWVNQNSVQLLRSYYGYLYGIDWTQSQGAAYRSSDTGRTWEKIGEGLPGLHPIGMVQSPDEKYLFVAYERDGIYRSSDSGSTWIKLIGPQFIVYGIYYFHTALFIGNAIGIYRSTDDGESWSYLTGSNRMLNVGHFASNEKILVASNTRSGTDSSIFFSTDLGDTWMNCSGNVGSQWTYVLFIQGNYIFVGLEDGIYRRPLSDLLAVLPSNSTTTALYPNPSSGIVYIQSGDDIHSITIANILGEVVYQSTGRETIEKTIDLSSHQSGVYNCVVRMGKSISHQSIILQK